MKAFCPSVLIAAFVALTFSACEKSQENIKTVSETKAVTTSRLIYPFIGPDMSDSILPMRNLPNAVVTKGVYNPNIKVKLIDTVCPDYLAETKKIDLTYLKDGEVAPVIKNNELSITISRERRGSFTKLSSGPNGWWTHWNYSPYTESEHPIVLFSRESYIDLTFNKAVKAFGFEVAPNSTGADLAVSVDYHDEPSYRSPPIFWVKQTVSSPSGARLIAVESSVPFNYIELYVAPQSLSEGGFGLANLRYKLPD
jgi:hypothetical protein